MSIHSTDMPVSTRIIASPRDVLTPMPRLYFMDRSVIAPAETCLTCLVRT